MLRDQIHEDLDLKMIHKFQSEIKYRGLKKISLRLILIFRTTYCCESLYSAMKSGKPKHCAIFTNQHLTELIRTVITTYQPDFQQLTANMETHKITTNGFNSFIFVALSVIKIIR